MRNPSICRMSEDRVYPSSDPSFFWGISSSKQSVPHPILGVEVVCCSIGVVRGVVQVVKNWFTGNQNPSRSSRLG